MREASYRNSRFRSVPLALRGRRVVVSAQVLIGNGLGAAFLVKRYAPARKPKEPHCAGCCCAAA